MYCFKKDQPSLVQPNVPREIRVLLCENFLSNKGIIWAERREKQREELRASRSGGYDDLRRWAKRVFFPFVPRGLIKRKELDLCARQPGQAGKE